MSASPDAHESLSPDDALPPVEPPSAGFILQLFVVPGIIVVIIVMVWLMFNWLAQMGNDPQAYVRALERNNEARWQAAVNLANALRDDRGPSHTLRRNHDLCQKLADILNREIDDAGMQDKQITLRIFLARALGEFQVSDGLPVLVKAATTARDERETDVRRAAIEAIAVLADNVRSSGEELPLQAQLDKALQRAAQDPDPRVRSVAAYALGVIGGSPYRDRLAAMLDDSYPDVRYNAATGLARHGDARAEAVLVEMLDPDESVGIEVEKRPESRDFKRAMIIVNGLRAGKQLSQQNRTTDLSSLKRAVDKLLNAKVDEAIRIEATELRDQLERRAPSKSRRAAAQIGSTSQVFIAEFTTLRNGVEHGCQ